jgi:hypothetical protein
LTHVLSSGAVTGLPTGEGPAGVAAEPGAPWEQVRLRARSILDVEPQVRFLGQSPGGGAPVVIDVIPVPTQPADACVLERTSDGVLLDGAPVAVESVASRLRACPSVAVVPRGGSWAFVVAAIDIALAARDDAPLLRLDPADPLATPRAVHWTELDFSNRVLPEWPEGYRSDADRVPCSVLVTVDAAGRPVRVAPVEECPEPLMGVVVAATQQSTWHPYRVDGEEVPARFRLTYVMVPPGGGGRRGR